MWPTIKMGIEGPRIRTDIGHGRRKYVPKTTEGSSQSLARARSRTLGVGIHIHTQ